MNELTFQDTIKRGQRRKTVKLVQEWLGLNGFPVQIDILSQILHQDEKNLLVACTTQRGHRTVLQEFSHFQPIFSAALS